MRAPPLTAQDMDTRILPLVEALRADGTVAAIGAAWDYLADVKLSRFGPGPARRALAGIQEALGALGPRGRSWADVARERLEGAVPNLTVVVLHGPAPMGRLTMALHAEHMLVAVGACFEFLYDVDLSNWQPGPALDAMRTIKEHLQPLLPEDER